MAGEFDAYDVHLVAAAVTRNADVICTANRAHLPEGPLVGGIEIVGPGRLAAELRHRLTVPSRRAQRSRLSPLRLSPPRFADDRASEQKDGPFWLCGARMRTLDRRYPPRDLKAEKMAAMSPEEQLALRQRLGLPTD